MKKRLYQITGLLFAAAFLLFAAAPAWACTSVYVGSEASAEGTTVIARSEDQSGPQWWAKEFYVEEARTEAGRFITDRATGFSVAIPETTCKYSYLIDSESPGDGQYYASCTNEHGVGVMGSVTIHPSDEWAALDPVHDRYDGLREAVIPAVVACQAASARDGVEILAGYMDIYGASECGAYFIMDRTDAWIFEIYGGSSYAAVRLPKDKVLVFGNEPVIWAFDFSDGENNVCSANLYDILQSLSVGVQNIDGTCNISLAYNPYPRRYTAATRSWAGNLAFAPSVTGGFTGYWAFSQPFTPDRKVSVLDVMRLYQDRYYGTDLDMRFEQNAGNYPIGTENSSEVHIIQAFSGLPKDSCLVQWLAVSSGDFAVFVPAFSGCTETYAQYHNPGADGYYGICRSLTEYAWGDRFGFGADLHRFNSKLEKQSLKTILKNLGNIRAAYRVSKEEGRACVTALSSHLAAVNYVRTAGLLSAYREY